MFFSSLPSVHDFFVPDDSGRIQSLSHSGKVIDDVIDVSLWRRNRGRRVERLTGEGGAGLCEEEVRAVSVHANLEKTDKRVVCVQHRSFYQ